MKRVWPTFATMALMACAEQETSIPERWDEGSVWSLEEQVSLAPEAEPFGRIADLEIGPDGAVYVLDALARKVRVFGLDGAERASLGERGRGPGQLEAPIDIFWAPGGELAVMDVGNGRIALFGADGESVDSWRPEALGPVFPLALGMGSGGRLGIVAVTSPDPARPAAAFIQAEIVDGSIRPVASHPLDGVRWPLLWEHRDESVSLVLPVPLSGEPRFALDDEGWLWYGNTADPTVSRWSAEGGFGDPVGRDQPRTPVTAAVREAALEASDFDEVRTNLGAAGIDEIRDMIPEVAPALDGFFADDEGHVWLVVTPDPSEDGGHRTIDIYDASGDWVGSVRGRFVTDPAPRVRDGVLAAVSRDALGVESVVVHRVVQPGG